MLRQYAWREEAFGTGVYLGFHAECAAGQIARLVLFKANKATLGFPCSVCGPLAHLYGDGFAAFYRCNFASWSRWRVAMVALFPGFHSTCLKRVMRYLAAVFIGVIMAVPVGAWASKVNVPVISAALKSAIMQVEMQSARGVAVDSTTRPVRILIQNFGPAEVDPKGRLLVEVLYSCDAKVSASALISAGLQIQVRFGIAPYCGTNGWVLPEDISDLAEVTGIKRLDLPALATANNYSGGSFIPESGGIIVDQYAIAQEHVNQFITVTSSNGNGIKVGVIADNDNYLSTVQTAGYLPANVTNYSQPCESGCGTNTPYNSEGTMMMELIYAAAPGAQLYFCNGVDPGAYEACLTWFQQNGVNIITDDATIPPSYTGSSLMENNDPFITAIRNFLSSNPNILIFSAVGNNATEYWEGPYNPVSLPTPLTCNGQTDNYAQPFGNGTSEVVSHLDSPVLPQAFLEWNDPYDSNSSNFDFYVLSPSGTVLRCANGTSTNYAQLNLNGNELNDQFVIATPDKTLAGKYLKLFGDTDGYQQFATTTPGAIISPFRFTGGHFIPIGALTATINNQVENLQFYSATGPTQLFFPTAETFPGPSLTAQVDGPVYYQGTGWTNPTFGGTSAAAPTAAAVAALLESANPSLTADQIITAMQQGADPMATTIPDGSFGYGRVNALGAWNTLSPQPSGTEISETCSGTTLVTGKANGQGGVTYTSSTNSTTCGYIAPPPPPPPPPPPAGSGGGGALVWYEVALLAVLLVFVYVSRRWIKNKHEKLLDEETKRDG